MKRFYKDVSVDEVDGGWQVSLDGRAIRTQGSKQPQIVPSRVLANALASEWQDQGDKIDPGLFLFRDHADFAIDIVRADRDAAIDKLIGYAETDTLCYRADPEDALYRHQQDRWEPLVEHLENRFGMRFQRVSGIVHRPQAEETLAVMYEGDDLEIGFNVHFLIEALNAVGSDVVQVALSGQTSPCLITDPEEEQAQFVISPMVI